MNEKIRFFYEMCLRVLSFMLANKADFSDIPFIAPTLAAFKQTVETLGELGAEKLTTTASAKDATISKSDARQRLRELLEDMRDIWRSVFDEVGGAQNKYRLPHGRDAQTLIAAGKSFAADAVADKQIFIEHGLPATFIDDLKNSTAEFAAAADNSATALGKRAGTNAAFDEPVKICRRAVEKFDAAVRRKYRNNPRKLAEWTIASHVERPPHPAAPSTPPTM